MKLSVIIPSYNCKHVARTVENTFENATGEIEIIVVLDGYWPDPLIKAHPNLIIVHKGINTGMRSSINAGVRLATGEYLLKIDDHCAVSKGFDEELIKGTESNWISIPSRYSLDVAKWETVREPIEYEFMTYPYTYLDKYRYGCGLTSKKWLGENGINPPDMGPSEFYWKEHQRKDIKIDEIMIFLGACWFMPKQHFFNIGGLDEQMFKTLYQEPQELTFKTYLSGGKVVVNKNCWFAHMFKGKDFGEDPNIRGYRLDLTAMRETERLGTNYWMNDRWPGASRKMEWLIDHFWPIPGWPDDWREQKILWEKKYPMQGI